MTSAKQQVAINIRNDEELNQLVPDTTTSINAHHYSYAPAQIDGDYGALGHIVASLTQNRLSNSSIP